MRFAFASVAVFLFSAPFLPAGDNDIVLNLDPSKTNPRNSEGAFVSLNDGTVLLFYTHFYGGAQDHSPARLVSVRSSDQGVTWSAPQTVIENHAKQNVMSVSLLRLKSGKIGLLYLVVNGLDDCRAVFRVSSDEAKTWSDPRDVMPSGYFVVNNDRMVQLTSRRLLVPAAWHDNQNKKFNSHAADRFFYSDDEGESWKEAPGRVEVDKKMGAGLQEPGVVELKDGTLMGWARTLSGAQYGFSSKDQGLNWTEAAPTEMKSPLSPASIKPLTDSKLLLIFNDHSGQFEFTAGKRTPLVSAISNDGGKTWGNRKLLESDKDGWYCYTAIHFLGDYVLLAYCAGDSKIGGLNRLRVRRVARVWFEQ